MVTVKNKIKIAMLMMMLAFIGCTKNRIYNDVIVEKYHRNTRYGSDMIFLRDGNGFTRTDCRKIFCKDYCGTIRQSYNTIFFTYEDGGQPNNEFNYMIKTESSLVVFSTYEGIKEKYSYLSPAELDKIDRDELHKTYTAAIEYIRIK